MRAPSGHDDRVWYQVEMPLDEIPANPRRADERSNRRAIALRGSTAAKVVEESRPRVLARSMENRVRMRARLVGKRCYVEAAEADVGASAPVVIRELIGAVRRGDIDLDDDKVRLVV